VSLRRVAALSISATTVVVALMFLGFILTPMCMCAPPPADYHPATPAFVYLWRYGPGAGIFFVTAYLGLGTRDRGRRIGAVLLALALSLIVIAVARMGVPLLDCCGSWAAHGWTP
jgi:hypothetical protein